MLRIATTHACSFMNNNFHSYMHAVMYWQGCCIYSIMYASPLSARCPKTQNPPCILCAMFSHVVCMLVVSELPQNVLEFSVSGTHYIIFLIYNSCHSEIHTLSQEAPALVLCASRRNRGEWHLILIYFRDNSCHSGKTPYITRSACFGAVCIAAQHVLLRVAPELYRISKKYCATQKQNSTLSPECFKSTPNKHMHNLLCVRGTWVL